MPLAVILLQAGTLPPLNILLWPTLATVLGSIVCMLAVWWHLRPLGELAEGLRLFRLEGYLPRFENARDDEIGLVSDSVSRLVGELDITLKKLKAQATTDLLTGLVNRRAMLDRGAEELARAQRGRETLSVVLMDLDNFRSVNEDFGQEIGDHVLVAIGQVLRDNLRPYDVAARMGGEEFLVLLPRTSLKDAKGVAERLRRSLEHTVISPLQRGRVTASFGLSVSHGGVSGLEDMIAEADLALYEAKRAGRNMVRVAEPISLDHILRRRT
ncbi:GGDEF domain-containing protein [Rhizobium sp. FKL33]|uniref:GGDEF domain-containing protein n=1 Tax=Rhizobium sp. FKL33 TaxID=2562307 RepID=UPI0014853D7D|nr:GGDEF domain-containing protein [Rhizobium sp. FKL33]